ncbi:eukaryotic translation initiation factor EIF2a, putative [Entamoeba histolytica HM-1:IMSS-B]|uniref:Eukaryotic translation initiation factor 2A n=5 Tax=Entamoeba histolytica TaxID=5759 RepID=C4M3B9_ENTH1|nr:hypothetical protein, conserved [Entamoeba histolytica HM-1:IMSS]EMD49743.1 eukaryotic translation initiation factor eIF2A protein, putative [Entamoeba histolytica KU27]EMH74743.1 eukaryotic translation initiation factor EIF2a, putative [Entamoeba histolytica HM-1:IMSS-B]EMS17464.1 eukaryotic translation initiation factor eif2a protein [Entamoeba histolytica HM-3:IMSS]GAT95803.1 hypothetical protein conserved [Entamoeba histolytica]EAL51710.1 hypothetical protein, conserved [Entamoeba histo|eukprot:XP_657100.1 hypothetical protein, conserved [Entamoeba histolytica HM-1:IMSS]
MQDNLTDTLSISNPYFVVKKNGVEVHYDGKTKEFTDGVDCFKCEALELLLIQKEKGIEVINYSFETLYEIEIQYIQSISVIKEFLHIFQMPPASNIKGYVKEASMYYLIELQRKTYNIGFSRRINGTPISWPLTSVKNNIIGIIEGNGVTYYRYEEDKICRTFSKENLINTKSIDRDELIGGKTIEFSPYDSGLVFGIFFPERNRFPGVIDLYRKEIGKPCKLINTISVLNGTSVLFNWCKKGHILLATTSTDFDETGHNYYGTSMLHSLYISENSNSSVIESKLDKTLYKTPTNNVFTQTLIQTQVQDVSFDPTGNFLAILYGTQPSKLVLFDTSNMNQIFSIQSCFFNTISFSYNSQFLAIAGFGNLPGDVEIYDTKDFKRVCKFASQCTTEWTWSNDNASIICGHCLPRRHFDNRIERFGIDGRKIERRDVLVKHITMFGIPSTKDVVFKYIEYNEENEIFKVAKKKN